MRRRRRGRLKEFNPAVPDGLQQILNWMMAKDPAGRYPTPDRAAQALNVFLAAGTDALASPEADPKMRPFLTWLEVEGKRPPPTPAHLPIPGNSGKPHEPSANVADHRPGAAAGAPRASATDRASRQCRQRLRAAEQPVTSGQRGGTDGGEAEQEPGIAIVGSGRSRESSKSSPGPDAVRDRNRFRSMDVELIGLGAGRGSAAATRSGWRFGMPRFPALRPGAVPGRPWRCLSACLSPFLGPREGRGITMRIRARHYVTGELLDLRMCGYSTRVG